MTKLKLCNVCGIRSWPEDIEYHLKIVESEDSQFCKKCHHEFMNKEKVCNCEVWII